MSRTLGTVVRGVRAPIFREGDNVVQITADTVLNALKDNGITARDGDIVAITESVVARCQGNYATVEQIAADVRAKTGGQTTQPGAKQQAGQGAEDISQMERGGAANGDGQPDPQRGAHKDQGSHQSGEDDFSCRELSFLFHFSYLPKSDAAIIAASGHKKSIRIIMKNRAR